MKPFKLACLFLTIMSMTTPALSAEAHNCMAHCGRCAVWCLQLKLVEGSCAAAAECLNNNGAAESKLCICEEPQH